MVLMLKNNNCRVMKVREATIIENDGLMRAGKYLEENGLKVATLVTDRHIQISKWVKENMSETDHRYDIWHLVKCKLYYYNV